MSYLFCRLGAYSLSRAPFGSGTGQIWLDEVTCLGTEGSLGTCGHNPWGTNDCSHFEDVGVVCSASKLLSYIFLTGIPVLRYEMCYFSPNYTLDFFLHCASPAEKDFCFHLQNI